jgi:hypothetical protein
LHGRSFRDRLGYVSYSLIELGTLRVMGTFQQGIERLLKGVELLLLAPLVYLVFGTMSTLVSSFRRRLHVLNGNSDETEVAASRAHLAETFHLVHQVKHSIAGLFVALLLTDLIGRVLEDRVFTWLAMASQVAALAMCIFYYVVQEHSNTVSPD